MAYFQATAPYVGELCYICQQPIKLGERVMFLGGPDLAHADCMGAAGANKSKQCPDCGEIEGTGYANECPHLEEA